MNEKKDILMLLKLPPPWGGGEIMHLLTAEAFRHRFTVLTLQRRRHDKAKQGLFRLDNLIHGLIWLRQTVVFCLNRRPKVVFLWLPKNFPAYIRTGIAAAVLKRSGIRVVGDLHGMGFDFAGRPLGRYIYRRLINTFAALRVLGEGIADQLRKSGYRGSTAVIDNGLAAPSWVLEEPVHLPEQPLQLLYLGAISAAKGFAEVCNLLGLLDHRQIDWRLIVAGEWVEPAFRRNMQKLIAASGWSERIRFVGLQLADAKWKLLTESHFLLHFSRRDGQPLTIIEAMAAGTPTIAYPIGAIPEMICDGGNGVLVKTVEEAAERIERLTKNTGEYLTLAENARATYRRRFIAERYLASLENFLKEIAHAADFSISKDG
ncbi:MAG: glycosyltransferase family 4 protein [candidate division KSB1 bacterium]|nr:glycosyltransferase family 4 protein [candidate division KSB1 bacterium]